MEAISELTVDADPDVIAAACQATIVWDLDVQPAVRLGQADTAAAARGIAQGTRMGAEAGELAARVRVPTL